jgi:hypothetical protein
MNDIRKRLQGLVLDTDIISVQELKDFSIVNVVTNSGQSFIINVSNDVKEVI